MANKKKPTSHKTYYSKKAVKSAKNYATVNPKGFLIALLLAAFVVGIGLAVYFLFLKKENPQPEPHTVMDGIEINFLELGNRYVGDSVYIKAGEADILIDAGSRNASATTIKNFIDQYCTDGTLEYVIATHAHQDHIAGFVGNSTNPGLFDTYNIDTLIDFSFTKETNPDNYTQVLKQYISKRESGLQSGKIKHHYTALECIDGLNGAKKEYTINDSIKMEILEHNYIRNRSSNENNHSVCTLFTHGTNHYLFTGDLEKAGEQSLVACNPNLPHVQLFKGGHHGSETANNDVLLDKITPEAVCICTCVGSDEYDSDHGNPQNWFPAQATINRIAKHTDKIYATTIMTDVDTHTYAPLNGNIKFKCEDGVSYVITGSNNSIKLKDTDWFRENRTWPEGGV